MALPLLAALPAGISLAETATITALAAGGALITKYGLNPFADNDSVSYDGTLSVNRANALAPSFNTQFLEETAKIEELPVFLKNEISSSSSKIDTMLQNMDFTHPTFEQTHVSTETTTSVPSTNLIDTIAAGVEMQDKWNFENAKLMNNLNESMEQIAISLNNLVQLNTQTMAIKQHKSNINDLNAQTLGNTLPVISQNLSLLPKLVRNLEVMAQSSITSVQLQDYQAILQRDKETSVNVTNDVATPAVNITNDVATPAVNITNDVATPAVNITNDVATPSVNINNDAMVEQLTAQTASLETIALKHHYEVNEQITLSNGEIMTPIQAKAHAHAEKAIETRSSNKIDAQDYFDMFDTSEFNIFTKIMKDLSFEESTNE